MHRIKLSSAKSSDKQPGAREIFLETHAALLRAGVKNPVEKVRKMLRAIGVSFTNTAACAWLHERGPERESNGDLSTKRTENERGHGLTRAVKANLNPIVSTLSFFPETNVSVVSLSPELDDLEPDVGAFLEVFRTANKSGKITAGRCDALRRDIAEIVAKFGVDAARAGIREVTIRNIPNVVYARKVAANYRAPARRGPLTAVPHFELEREPNSVIAATERRDLWRYYDQVFEHDNEAFAAFLERPENEHFRTLDMPPAFAAYLQKGALA